MPEYAIPLGALLAAERAYDALDDEQRSHPDIVAKRLLQAAAPFAGPIAAQLGRGRIDERAGADILGRYLRGTSRDRLADVYAVTTKTIGNHIRRRVRRELARSRAGVPVSRIARELGCSAAALVAEFEREARHARQYSLDPYPETNNVPVRIDSDPGAVERGRQRSDAGRRRPRPGGLSSRRRESIGVLDPAA
jgi:hypothetical protein